VGFKDFAFFRIIPTAAHLVAGFGRIVDLAPNRFLTDLAGAEELLEAEAAAVEHMNEHHRDAMDLYATASLGADSADWRCIGCDPEGMDMQVGRLTLRLEFPERVMTAAELPRMLIRLAGEAAKKV
jgi:putative heme iron utilization protein